MKTKAFGRIFLIWFLYFLVVIVSVLVPYIFLKGVSLQIASILIQIVLFVGLVLLVRKKYKLNCTSIKFRKMELYVVFLCMVIATTSLVVVNTSASYIFSSFLEKTQSNEPILSTTENIFMCISAVLIAPILEEIICRFCCIESTKQLCGVPFALICSSLFFGLSHFSSVSKIVASVISGIVFGLVYIATKNIWYAVITHSINNIWPVILEYFDQQRITLFNQPIYYERDNYIFMSFPIYIICIVLLMVSGLLFWKWYQKQKSIHIEVQL